MSSYDVKSKLGGGKEMQDLTLQWGYRQNHAPARQRVDWNEKSEFGRNAMSFLKPIISAVMMLAGAATTLTVLATIAWTNGLIVF